MDDFDGVAASLEENHSDLDHLALTDGSCFGDLEEHKSPSSFVEESEVSERQEAPIPPSQVFSHAISSPPPEQLLLNRTADPRPRKRQRTAASAREPLRVLQVSAVWRRRRGVRDYQEGDSAAAVTTATPVRFVETIGSTWKVTTSWQWNGDKENALQVQQAALSNSPQIGTLLPTLKLLLLHRARRVAAAAASAPHTEFVVREE